MKKIKPIYCVNCFLKRDVLIYPVVDDTLLLNMIRVSCPCCFSDVTSFRINRAIMKWNHMQANIRRKDLKK